MPDRASRLVLIFGRTGQVGHELARAKWPKGVAATILARDDADFINPARLSDVVRQYRPDAVVIAAGYTDVDGAEQDAQTAMTVNAVAPGVIARAAAERSVPVIYISTDYVFDGRKITPYDERDPVAPLNTYGRSKLAGERRVRAANRWHLILRTSWLYGPHGSNFLKTMLCLAERSEEVSIVADQQGCPTRARDVAAAIAQITPRLFGADALWGTYHLAGATGTTWHGFAESIFSTLAARGRARPRNSAITSAEFAPPARRPSNSRLSSCAFQRDYGIRLPGYVTALASVLDEALSAVDPPSNPPHR